jgi:serine/threonine protein kinase
MSYDAVERNLVFGLLALQSGLLEVGQLAEAFSEWTRRQDSSLADLLVKREYLSENDRVVVEHLLERRLQKQGDFTAVSRGDDPVTHLLDLINGPELDGPNNGLRADDQTIHHTTANFAQEKRDRYQLTRLHAEGGIGRIWLAHDNALGRDVALKELRADRADNRSISARFLEEARITGQLEHPGIAPVYEMAPANDSHTPFYTMRFVKGRTLSEAIQSFHERRKGRARRALALRELLNAFIAVCHTVAYAHARSVIHRDLKPQNVVLGDFGETFVLDWGLAKLITRRKMVEQGEKRQDPARETPDIPELPAVVVGLDGPRDQTVHGQILGTPGYLSPEQAEGRLDALDERSDIYGLGAILYEILTGQAPFTGESTHQVLRKAIYDPVVPPSQLVPTTPTALEAVCLKALAKSPAERYASARDLARDIQRWLADEPVSSYRDPLTARLSRWLRRRKGIALASYGALVILLTIQTASSWFAEQEKRRDELKLITARNDRWRASVVSEQHELEQAVLLTELAHQYRNQGLNARAEAAQGRAVEIYDRLSRTQPEARMARAVLLAMAGQFTQSAAEVKAAISEPTVLAPALYEGACSYALLAGRAERDKQQQMHDMYARQAVELLKRAVVKGRLTAETIERDRDLDSIRQRYDYQELLSALRLPRRPA